MKNYLLFFALCLVVWSACRKDPDEEFPAIVVVTPTANTQVQVGDTLHVEIKLTDNQRLQDATIQLINSTYAPVLSPVNYTLSGRETTLNFAYAISDIRLLSGLYYLEVRVSDGSNNARKFVPLQLAEIPQRRLGLFIATHPSLNSVNIYKADSLLSVSPYLTFTSDYSDLGLSDYWQQVYLCGRNTGALRALSIDGSTAGWMQNAGQGTSPWFRSLYSDVKNIYVSYEDQHTIKRIDQAGAINWQVNTGANAYPELVYPVNDRVYVAQYDVANTQHQLAVFSIPGAGGLQQCILGYTPVALFPKDNDNVYVLGNSGNAGQIRIYDYTANGVWTPVTLPAATVSSATQIDASTLLIGMGDGEIYKFTYNPIGVVPWANSGVAAHLRYDAVTDEIYAAVGTQIKVYDYTTASLQQTLTVPDTIVGFQVWHNR